MKRRVLMLALFVVIGAIVNVAVAWGCAMRFDPSHAKKTNESFDIRNGMQENRFTWRQLGYRRVERLYNWPQTSDNTGHGGPTKPNKPRVEMNCGWPVHALTAIGFGVASTTAEATSNGVRSREINGRVDRRDSAIALNRVRGTYFSWQALPSRPIWPGFAINTVFYAFILWLLFAAPFALRRRIRIKRGVCPKCAYPIGSSDVCTECGTPKRTVSRQHAVSPMVAD